MEALVKKYFWLINLAFLFVGAWLLAGTINVVVAHKLRSLPALPEKAKKSRTIVKTQRKNDNNHVIVDRNYFESAMAVPVETTEDGPSLDESSAAELDGVESTMRASLVGTIVANKPEWSMAMITDLTSSETGIYRNRDTLMEEATIVAIHARRVIVKRNGVHEYLELQEKGAPKKPKISSRKSPRSRKSGKDALGEGVKKVGEDSWVIDRNEIDKTLANLNSIAMQARIVPSFKNGESNGFKLFAIRPGSVYSKLGIQNGDIIHKINGFAINSPDKALEIYQKLKSARSVEIELTRRGKGKKLNYRIE